MTTLNLDTILSRTREISQEIVAVEAEAVDQKSRWPEKAIRAMQETGLGGLVAPEETGGLGHGLLALAQVCEVLGRECASTAICFGMHCVGTAVIAAKATLDQKVRYLEPISQGKHLTTLSLSEPGTGAHFYYPQTRLVAESEETYRINGTKCFVTNGSYADSYVISVVATGPDTPPGVFSCAVIPNNLEGLVWGPQWQGLGMRGNSSRSVEMNNIVLPRQDLLGEEGDQLWYIFNVVAPFFLIAMAGTYLGIASSAFEVAKTHLEQREHAHTGSTLGQNSVLQHRLGGLWAAVERTRQLIYYAAKEGDSEGPNTLPALLSAKAEVADCVVAVVNEAMTLTGGMTYRDGSKLERHLRDARASHVMSPTTDILKTWTGRAVLNQPLLD